MLAAIETETLCEYVIPGPSAGDCGEFVVEIESLQPVLIETIAELEAIRPRGEVSAGAAELEVFDLFLDVLYASRAMDQAIIDGWKREDVALWRDGWSMRSSVAEKLRQFLEAVEGLSDER